LSEKSALLTRSKVDDLSILKLCHAKTANLMAINTVDIRYQREK
jgi:hypothetical protein